MLDLQLNNRYSSFAEQKSHIVQKLIATLNADDRKSCWTVQYFFQCQSKTRFIRLIYSTKNFIRLLNEPKKYMEKQPIISITSHQTKTLPENAVLLQTHWQIVDSVPRIVLKYLIALCKPKSYLEAIKYYYSTTEKKKSVWKCRVSDISSQKLFYIFASTKQERTRCTITGKPKAIFENNWPLALFYMKRNFLQKTPCFGKIPTEKVIPVVWAKRNFWCEALQRPKSKLKIMKGYSWSMEAQGCLKMLFCEYTSERCSRALTLPQKLTY